MGAFKKMFSGKAQRQQQIAAAEQAAKSEALQRESIDSQQAAQRKQLEIQQNERARQENQIGDIRRQRRGARLLMAAETGFGGVTSSKLG